MRKKTNIKIEVVETAPPVDVEMLYRDAGWWQNDYEPSFIPGMISGSCVFVVAMDGDAMIGMGRAVSDGASDAYIQDVVVLTAYRKRGIGGMIIRKLVGELQRCDIDWIGLIGEPGTQSFYEKLGFKLMPDFVPMHYEN